MREIVFDTETTGLRPEDGDRVIEIGAVELENRFPTGQTFHTYVNPQGRGVHPEAEAIHGIGDLDLVDKPVFAQIAEAFLEFVADANLVAHNATFDIGFINAELGRLRIDPVPQMRVVDTLVLARRKHPMGPNSLDALCTRYGIDNSHRTKHGALLDAELLAEVYIEMTGGRQASLVLDEAAAIDQADTHIASIQAARSRPNRLPPRLSAEEIAHHREFIDTFKARALWLDYRIDREAG